MTDLLDTSKVIVGASGSGKTVTAKADVAALLAARRHVLIIDPTGVWWGMRSSAAGDGAGFDLPIFGGEHGDVPIRASQGAAIARIVVDQRVSAIVDLSAIDNSADWRLFVHDLVAELRRRPRGNFHLVVDEADEFAPERVADDVGFALRENLIWIAKRGRAHGWVPTWITQRTPDIAKAVISQAQTIVAHQLVAPTDQKPIDDYLKNHGSAEVRREVMGSLAQLAVGERWIYSPRAGVLERGMTPALSTFDSSRTPEAGETLVEPRTLAQLDVSAIAAALAPPIGAELPDDTIPADPKAAWEKGGVVGGMLVERDRRIAELEEQLATANARVETLEFVSRRALTIAGRISADFEQLLALVDLEHADLHSSYAVSAPKAAATAVVDASPTGGLRAPAATGGASDRDLRALAGLAAVYPAGLSEAAWATRTGYSRKGGAWNARRRRYVDAGLIEQRDRRWFATAAGVDAAGAEIPRMPAPGPALVAWWADRLGTPGKMLRALADIHPRQVTREQLASLVNMSAGGGAFSSRIQELKAAELVIDNRKRLGLAPGLMGDA